MTLLLDTSLLIAGYDPGDESVAVSAVSIGELQVGVLSATDPAIRAARQARLLAILEGAEVLPVSVAVAASYGALRSASGRRPTNDLWIAATAEAHRLTLLTADEHQARLPVFDVRMVAEDGPQSLLMPRTIR